MCIAQEVGLTAGLALERRLFQSLFSTEDQKEGESRLFSLFYPSSSLESLVPSLVADLSSALFPLPFTFDAYIRNDRLRREEEARLQELLTRPSGDASTLFHEFLDLALSF